MLGQYSPAESPERSVFVVSHPELLDRFVRPASGCRVFSAIRIGLISVNGNTLIPLQNPEYWGNAYLQDEYSKAETVINNLSSKISKTIQAEFTAASLGSVYGSSQ